MPTTRSHALRSRLVSDCLADRYFDAIGSKEDFECPCCFEVIVKQSFALAICGHYTCLRCHLKAPTRCPICRDEDD